MDGRGIKIESITSGANEARDISLTRGNYEYPEIKRFSYLREIIAFLRVYLGILKRGEKCSG